MKKKMKQLVIPIAQWLHGSEDKHKRFDNEIVGSMLYRPQDDKLCCLGHYLKACCVPIEKLKLKDTPYDVSKSIPKTARWLLSNVKQYHYFTNSSDAVKLMNANDNNGKTQRSVITKIFRKHNVAVKFVGKGK